MTRRFQFSLKTMLAAGALFCAFFAWLGWSANRARVQRDAANKLAEMGATVGYGLRYPDFRIPILDDSMHTKTLLWHFRCQGRTATIGTFDGHNYPETSPLFTGSAEERHISELIRELRRLPCLTTVYIYRCVSSDAEAALRSALPRHIIIHRLSNSD